MFIERCLILLPNLEVDDCIFDFHRMPTDGIPFDGRAKYFAKFHPSLGWSFAIPHSSYRSIRFAAAFSWHLQTDRNQIDIPRLVIAGVSSGVGKTSVVVGLARALALRGLSVALFKCGPDYLDPSYHRQALGRTSHNLDGWMMGRPALRSIFMEHAGGHDIAIIEGVMGLFDGASPHSEHGSTAEIAKWLSAPVVAICDASGMARTIAAIAHGLCHFDPDLNFAGMIANRVGSPRHSELLAASLPPIDYFGGLSREPNLAFPERHLGLQTARGELAIDEQISSWSDKVARELELDKLLSLARSAPSLPLERPKQVRSKTRRQCTLALAKDDAFHFYYESNLQQLRDFGAEIVEFSPLHDRHLPQCQGILFGGGYPEQHAQALAKNESMRSEIYDFAQHHPIYAECGGLMYMGVSISDFDGQEYPMTGLLPGRAIICDRIQALGYIEVKTNQSTLLGPAGTQFRGHQFRYSRWEWINSKEHSEASKRSISIPTPILLPSNVSCSYVLQGRRSGGIVEEGYRCGHLLASYVHAHWATTPDIPRSIVQSCARDFE